MRKITFLVSCFTILFIACKGDPGPAGPPGTDGFIGQVFEVQLDFTGGDSYENTVPFPSSINVFNSDVVMAYILDEVIDGVQVWEPLPQSIFLGNDILLYGYDHTTADINFFIDGTVAPETLAPVYTDDIVFRIAIIPADFAKDMDLTNLEQVMSNLQIKNAVPIFTTKQQTDY